MPACLLKFPQWLQEPIEEGCLTPHQAWQLEWEIEMLQGLPWTPGVFEIKQRVVLFHMERGPRALQ